MIEIEVGFVRLCVKFVCDMRALYLICVSVTPQHSWTRVDDRQDGLYLDPFGLGCVCVCLCECVCLCSVHTCVCVSLYVRLPVCVPRGT